MSLFMDYDAEFAERKDNSMTQQELYQKRYDQGATVALFIAYWCDADMRTADNAVITKRGVEPSDGPSLEAVATAYQEHFYPNPLYAITDAYDIYLWRALDQSA